MARGEAEIGFQQISELLPVEGIYFVGPLPAEVQRVTVFSAGVGAASTHPAVAKRFIDFLASPAATGTTSVTVRDGLSCACAGQASSDSAIASQAPCLRCIASSRR